jgi:hypothetical protein
MKKAAIGSIQSGSLCTSGGHEKPFRHGRFRDVEGITDPTRRIKFGGPEERLILAESILEQLLNRA